MNAHQTIAGDRGAVPARGAATLVVVMVLFFVMAMVAAYANRTLIYEQRISSNSYRAVSAMNAAEAAVDWTVGMLSGGRIDTACVASTSTADNTFRQRYTAIQADGSYLATKWNAGANSFRPSCVITTAGMACSCPTGADPTLSFAQAPAPVFRVYIDDGGAPGLVVLRVRGCANISNSVNASTNPNGDESCHRSTSEIPLVDSYADLRVVLGMVRAMPIAPPAALTVGNTVTMDGTTLLRVANTDAGTGVTVHAGAGITATNVSLLGPAGSVGETRVVNDTTLAGQSTGGTLFNALFGMDMETFSRQPAAVVVNCTTPCTSSSIASVVSDNPGRIVWINGNLTLDTPGTLGSASEPVMLVSNGDITISSSVVVNGFVYARDITWSSTSTSTVIRGAVVASRNVTGNGPVSVAYDASMLGKIAMGYGSFVRVPGTWSTTQN